MAENAMYPRAYLVFISSISLQLNLNIFDSYIRHKFDEQNIQSDPPEIYDKIGLFTTINNSIK